MYVMLKQHQLTVGAVLLPSLNQHMVDFFCVDCSIQLHHCEDSDSF